MEGMMRLLPVSGRDKLSPVVGQDLVRDPVLSEPFLQNGDHVLHGGGIENTVTGD